VEVSIDLEAVHRKEVSAMIIEIIDEGIQSDGPVPMQRCCWFIEYPYYM
jgi:hypothetical protein